LPRVYSSRHSCHGCGSVDHFKNRCPKVKREKQKLAKEKFEANKMAKNLVKKPEANAKHVQFVNGVRRIERPKKFVENTLKVPKARGNQKSNPKVVVKEGDLRHNFSGIYFNRNVYKFLPRFNKAFNRDDFRANNGKIIIGGSKSKNLAQEHGTVNIEASTSESIKEVVNNLDIKQAKLATTWSKEASYGLKKENMALLQDAERKWAIRSKRSSKRNYQENGPSAHSTSPSPSTTQAINLKKQVYTPTKSRSSMEQPASCTIRSINYGRSNNGTRRSNKKWHVLHKSYFEGKILFCAWGYCIIGVICECYVYYKYV